MKKRICLLLAFITCCAILVPSSNAFHPYEYPIHIIDSDGDYFYLNPKYVDSYLYTFFEGICVRGSDRNNFNAETYDCTLMIDNKMNISIASFYKWDSIFYAHTYYESPALYKGSMTWLKIQNPKYKKVEDYAIRITKGDYYLPKPKIITIPDDDVIPGQDDDPNTLKLGALIPLSGDLASLGEAYAKTLEQAQEDAQEYLNQSGSELSVELLVEDNQTDPAESYHRIQDLRAKGVSIFLGPQDSDSIDYVKQITFAGDYLLFSSSSTAISLSLPDDNVMRCISDDTHQAAALIKKAQDDGVTDLYIIARTNLYGYDFYKALERGFIEKGGAVKTFLYSKPFAEVPYVVEELTTALSEQAALNDGKKVGVTLISFDEGIDIMELASDSTDAGNVPWYGTDSLAQSMALLQNPKAAEFAAQTNFTCTTIGRPQNDAFQAVADKVEAKLGYAPPTLALLIYDAYQMAVRAYQKAGTNEVETMKSALAEVAETYQGISGDMSFNTNGDRAEGMYDYWNVYAENGQYFWDSESNWTGQPVPIMDWALFE